MFFSQENGALIGRQQEEVLRLEAWGKNSLRVRATRNPGFSGSDHALCFGRNETQAEIGILEKGAVIRSGKLRAEINTAGVISFFRGETLLLREYYRFYEGTISKESRCLRIISREFKAISGNGWKLTVRFEGRDDEKIFGMGQYQHAYLNQKGCLLELAQRNSQVSIPFAVSSFGYGFLWNNPAVGSANFGRNMTLWQANETEEMDYWITAEDTPAGIVENYTAVTGRAPVMPENLLGLWQCKLRYRTQEEVLSVAREYKKLGIPLSVIVIDFFHWARQGDWSFDPEYWPDPKAMTDELHSMGIHVMVSVWPSVDRKSRNYAAMRERGFLTSTRRGTLQTYDYCGDCAVFDATNPQAREYVWNQCRRNYLENGIDYFWLDNAEPDLAVYDFDNIRYALGSAEKVGNLYPLLYTKGFYDGLRAENRVDMVNLVRCAWAGSQKYAALVWSGDVPSTFESLRDQIMAGLNMGLAGIPWWTTDIGGFMGGNGNDPAFRELLLRWFQFAVFTPVLRMHGDREPHSIPALSDLDYGGGFQ